MHAFSCAITDGRQSSAFDVETTLTSDDDAEWLVSQPV
jgi:hypothetical protein